MTNKGKRLTETSRRAGEGGRKSKERGSAAYAEESMSCVVLEKGEGAIMNGGKVPEKESASEKTC